MKAKERNVLAAAEETYDHIMERSLDMME